jgi:hypothetical protein
MTHLLAAHALVGVCWGAVLPVSMSVKVKQREAADVAHALDAGGGVPHKLQDGT